MHMLLIYLCFFNMCICMHCVYVAVFYDLQFHVLLSCQSFNCKLIVISLQNIVLEYIPDYTVSKYCDKL